MLLEREKNLRLDSDTVSAFANMRTPYQNHFWDAGAGKCIFRHTGIE